MFKTAMPTDDQIARRILAILGDQTLPYEELFAQCPMLAHDSHRFGRILARMEEYPLIFIERRADGTRHVRRPRPLTGYGSEWGDGSGERGENSTGFVRSPHSPLSTPH